MANSLFIFIIFIPSISLPVEPSQRIGSALCTLLQTLGDPMVVGRSLSYYITLATNLRSNPTASSGSLPFFLVGHFERKVAFGYDADLSQVTAEFSEDVLRFHFTLP